MAAVTAMVCMLLIVAVPFYLILHRRSNSSKELPDNRTSDPGQCQVLIAGRLARNGEHNRLNPQESRIIPNRTRRIAFGIDNIFTSLNSEYAQGFLRQAKIRVSLKQERWNQIAELARESARKLTLNGPSNDYNADGVFKIRNDYSIRIRLVSLVSILSLKVVLFTMFDRGDGDDTNDFVLDAFAKAINWTWIASKERNSDLVPRFEDNSKLRSSLGAIFGNDDAGPTNPLNFIIPSFETLWRVVLRAFVEVGFSTGATHPEWKHALTAFSRHPTKKQFETTTYMNLEGSSPAHDIPSAKHIVSESLRLYPPTRRIHRAYQWSDIAADDNQESKIYDDMAADIEACHLRSDIWGPHALVFNPERWKQPTSRQQDAFMPFGHKPFQCPAESVFGPRMIGILVGALLEALTSETMNEWKLESVNQGEVDEMLCGRRLEMDRNAYEHVDLVGYRAGDMDEDTWAAGFVD